MSTFSGILAELDGISIDRFNNENLQNRAFFLSHCHSDHMIGLANIYESLIESHSDSRIYMSSISSIIVKNMFPNLSQYVVSLKIQVENLIKIPQKNGTESYVIVILVPAGHCPGSVMFIFEDPKGLRVLYTGDFRISPSTLPKIKSLHNSNRVPKTFDALYFDSTFWSSEYDIFPNRDDSCDAICKLIRKWISKSRKHFISLSTPARYGTEYLLIEIYKRIKMPIHVSKEVYKTYSSIVDMEGVFTSDPTQTQVHCCDYNTSFLKCLDGDSDFKIRNIRISAMMWRNLDKDSPIFKRNEEKEKYFVCYSSHCSYGELKEFLKYFKPKTAVPCVVPQDCSSKFKKSIKDFVVNICNKNDTCESDDFVIITKTGDFHDDVPKISNKNVQYPVRNELTLKNKGFRLSNIIKDSDDTNSSFKLCKKIKIQD